MMKPEREGVVRLPVQLDEAQRTGLAKRMGMFRWFYNEGLAAWRRSPEKDYEKFRTWLLPVMRTWRSGRPWLAGAKEDLLADAADYLLRAIARSLVEKRPELLRYRKKKRGWNCGFHSKTVLLRARHVRLDDLGEVALVERTRYTNRHLYGFALTRRSDKVWELTATRRT